MLTDHEAAWMALKALILAKPSHGQRDLLADMARLEVEYRVPEGQEVFDDHPPRLRYDRTATGRRRVGVGDV